MQGSSLNGELEDQEYRRIFGSPDSREHEAAWRVAGMGGLPVVPHRQRASWASVCATQANGSAPHRPDRRAPPRPRCPVGKTSHRGAPTIHATLTRGAHGVEKPLYIRDPKMSSQRNTDVKMLTIAPMHTNWLCNQRDWAGRIRGPIHTTR